jgi:hypothetical protein
MQRKAKEPAKAGTQLARSHGQPIRASERRVRQ